MVNEREPPRPPFYSDQNTKRDSPNPVVPEFGKPSTLGPNRANPLYIPKANKPRLEHHRPVPSSNPPLPNGDKRQADPFRVVRPSSSFSGYRSSHVPHDADVVEITQPTNSIWTTQPTSKPYFSSKPISKPVSKSSSNLQSFIDLTTSTIGKSTNASHFADDSRAIDAYSYLDSAKANENIKALLEGAFEDEDDKPRTRLRKKKLQSQVDELTEKLGGVNVNGKDENGTKDSVKTEEEAEEEEEEEEDDGAVEGLKVTLLPHQIEGVAWMRDKETGLTKTRGVLPKGGILADDMGLGKTIQTIALMLTNPSPPPKSSEEEKKKDTNKIPLHVGKSTLIVAPVALVKQWESEINTKIEQTHRLKVGIYHGPGRAKIAKDLTKFDVVITTYGTLSSENGGSVKGKDGVEGKTGCFGVHWYRIVLDEAHTIKNRNAKSTQAVYELNSLYRWCLTGTPMQNNLDELQSLIRFLRIKPYDELAAWRDQITRPLNNGRGGLAIRRLQVYLKAFMKRRTKDVLKLNGGLGGKSFGDNKESKDSPGGFRITKRDVIKVEADFTEEERQFYSRLEDRTDKSLENMIGHQKLNYASALVLLLRLRQACNHVELVKGDLAQEKDTIVNANQAKNSQGGDIDEIANMLGGLTVMSKRCDICLIDLTPEEAKSGAIRCADCETDLKIHTGLVKSKREKKQKKKKQPKEEQAQVSSIPQQRRRGQRGRPVILDSDDEEEGEWIVPADKRTTATLGTAGGTDDEDAEGGGEWIGSEDSETEDDEDGADEVSNQEEDSGVRYGGDYSVLRDVTSSTKIRHLMRILKREAGQFKFIVFSVFTSMLDKIESFLKAADIGYARYDGGMRNDHREASLEKLRNSSGTRILLCSLRAGSLGLNLTAASRVVILEPFWNPFVEEQAIDRVHRLNQTVDVKVYKMTIKDTVEERILDLQERKRELASATIEGKTAAGKLTMNDMLALFRHDAESKFAEDEDLDFSAGKGKLLESRESTDHTSMDSGLSQGRRSTPPAMERDRNKNRRPVPESSIYGRRW